MSLTVIGIFDKHSEAQQAVDQLISNGFDRSEVDFSAQMGEFADADEQTATLDEGVGNFFSSMFDDEDDAHRYARAATRRSVVTVHARTDERAEQAANILDDNGAIDVKERVPVLDSLTRKPSASMGAAFLSDEELKAADQAAPVTTNNDQTIKVIEENLEVGKREVNRGSVRVRSRIIARPVEESIRLRKERVTLQRKPVSRPATAAELDAFGNSEIKVTEHAEIPIISKTANVVEEIVLGKETNVREEVIRDTVRKTEVDVDQLGSTDRNNLTERTTDREGDGITYATK